MLGFLEVWRGNILFWKIPEFSVPTHHTWSFYQFGVFIEISREAVKLSHWCVSNCKVWVWLGVTLAVWGLTPSTSWGYPRVFSFKKQTVFSVTLAACEDENRNKRSCLWRILMQCKIVLKDKFINNNVVTGDTWQMFQCVFQRRGGDIEIFRSKTVEFHTQ